MTEAGFTRAIHKKLPSTVYHWKVNDRFTVGVPDAWYSGERGDLWVEYKFLPKLPRVIRHTLLSDKQRHWLNLRHAEGRNVMVAIGHEKRVLVLEHGNWNYDQDRQTFESDALTRQDFVDTLTHIVT